MTLNYSYDWSDKTILIAEDEETNFIFLREALKRTHANLIWAQNGQEAVELYHENQDISVILMDIKMPVMNGNDATKIIRNKSNVPIIVQTSHTLALEKVASFSAGCNEYITKPIKINTLLSTISKFID